MKHGSNPRRGRSRGNGKRHPASRSQNFESSGPDVKIRGSAQQVQEKYLNLARDAFSAGDRIAAEGYFQHAEHYYRLANPYTGPNSGSNAGQEADQGRDARSPKAPPERKSEVANEPVVDSATDAKAEVVADAPVADTPVADTPVAAAPVADTPVAAAPAATAVTVPIDVAGAGVDDKPAAPKRRTRGRKPAKADASEGGGTAGDEDAAAAGDSVKKPIPAA